LLCSPIGQTYALLLLFVGDELIDGGDVSLGQIHHVKVVALQVVQFFHTKTASHRQQIEWEGGTSGGEGRRTYNSGSVGCGPVSAKHAQLRELAHRNLKATEQGRFISTTAPVMIVV